MVSVVVAIVTSVINPVANAVDRSVRVSELASGKVWIRYPIVRPQDVQVEEQREQEEVHVQPMVTEVPVAAAIEPVVSAPVVEEVAGVVEAPVQVAEPQPEVVETTHPGSDRCRGN